MVTGKMSRFCFLIVFVFVAALAANAQSFRVQCPWSTITHPYADKDNPDPLTNNVEPPYTGTTKFRDDPDGGGYLVPDFSATGGPHINGAIKCQQISGGDGFATMGDGTQIYTFSFGPLSGITDIANGKPGTEFPDVFNTVYSGTFMPGDPATADSAGPGPNSLSTFPYNGAVGLAPDPNLAGCDPTKTTSDPTNTCLDGHVDPRPIMDVGVMNGNFPAPMFAVDEDDEFFLTLTNVGMVMRPDLFEQHTVHWHGYPNASSFYDGVPDASVAINIGASFTYYYLAADAGTYFWHCHITPPEHLQMGMVGQIFVRPRQDRVPSQGSLYRYLELQELDPRTACNPDVDILCANPLPYAGNNGIRQGDSTPGGHTYAKYAYNDGDGSTEYDVEYPIQIHGFDPNFHFVGMTFNPENFADMKDKYFTLNGRSYPDTVMAGPMATQSTDGSMHYAQPLPSIINIPEGGRALLRLSDLDVQEHQTLASLGIPMTVIALNAKLLRDQSGNNLYYKTNSITLGGGESLDVILDATDKVKYPAGSVFYLYTPNLDHLSNDAENFGGLMTEVHICSSVTGGNTFGNTCE